MRRWVLAFLMAVTANWVSLIYAFGPVSWLLTTILLLGEFLYFNLRPIEKSGAPTKRIWYLKSGCELLRLFLITATVTVFVQMVWLWCQISMITPENSLAAGTAVAGAAFGVLWAVLLEAIVFWNGMIRVYLTSVQLGLKHRVLAALCLWFGGQWRGSGLIQWFIHPPLQLEQAELDHSVFARLWRWIHGGLCRLYRALRLDRLFEGSIFQKCWLWAGAAAVLAPIIPTMAVLGLVLVSAFSLLLNLMADSGRKLYYAPMNRYLWLYAAIYLAGTWFSVTRAGSLLGGVLTVAFILFAVILENSITTRRQLDTLLLLLVMAGTAVALYGICQYLFGWGYQSAAWADSEMFGDVFRVHMEKLFLYLLLAI